MIKLMNLLEGVDFNLYKSQLKSLLDLFKSEMKKGTDTEKKVFEYQAEGYFKRALEMGIKNKFISNLTRKRVNKITRKAGLEHGKLEVMIEAMDFILLNLENDVK